MSKERLHALIPSNAAFTWECGTVCTRAQSTRKERRQKYEPASPGQPSRPGGRPEPSVPGQGLGGPGGETEPPSGEGKKQRGEDWSTRGWMQLFPLIFPLFLQIKQTCGRYVHREHRMNVKKQQTLLTNLRWSRILKSWKAARVALDAGGTRDWLVSEEK